MNEKMKLFFERFIPFVLIGIATALIVGLFIMLSYILLWGLVIGSLLWAISFIKELLLPNRKKDLPTKTTKGRIIEHDRDL